MVPLSISRHLRLACADLPGEQVEIDEDYIYRLGEHMAAALVLEEYHRWVNAGLKAKICLGEGTDGNHYFSVQSNDSECSLPDNLKPPTVVILEQVSSEDAMGLLEELQ